jgi:hypothetical protein
MSKKSPAPPATPDYAAAATAQGAANLQSGLQTAYLGNPNVYTPYGNQIVTFNKDEQGNTQPTVTQTLTPAAQKALEDQQRVQAGLSNLAMQGTEQASNILNKPFNYNGPNIQTSLAPAQPLNYGPTMGQYGMAQGVDEGRFGQAGTIGADKYGLARGNLDLSNVAAMPINAGTTAQQAIMNRLSPQLAQSDEALRSQLANQGITEGSEAYNRAMTQSGQNRNDLLSQAALQGINLDLSANQQGFGQAATQAGLYNQAVGQNFGQGLQSQQLGNQAMAQNFQTALDAQNSRNAAMAQNYGQASNIAGLYNQAQNQGYNQNLQNAQFGNTAAQQSLAQQFALRNQPLNEISALMSGGQIQNPQFQGYTGANVAAAPVFQSVQAQNQADQNTYNQKVAQQNAMYGMLGNVAGMAAGGYFASDIRLKSNIERVGTHPLGVGIYEYDIDGHRERGVMAQEVMGVKPHAVHMHPDGYYMVNYGAL